MTDTARDLADGLARVAADLADLTDAEQAAAAAVLDALRPRVPRRSGRLLRSGRVETSPTVRAAFGGPAAPYAAAVNSRRPFLAADPDTAVRIVTQHLQQSITRNL